MIYAAFLIAFLANFFAILRFDGAFFKTTLVAFLATLSHAFFLITFLATAFLAAFATIFLRLFFLRLFAIRGSFFGNYLLLLVINYRYCDRF